MSISSLLGSQSHELSDNFSRTKSLSYNNKPSITILFSEVYIYLISGFISEDAQMLNFSKFSVRL